MRAEGESASYAAWPELHEEVARLPQRYREPVVLCYLEGMTTEAAASRLGCPKGTVLSRLSRARDQLRGRLVRRGVSLQSIPLGVEIVASSLPRSLIESTSQAATLYLTESSAAGTVPAAILAEGLLRAMLMTKLKTIAVVVSLIGVGVGGTGVYAYQQRTAQKEGAAAGQGDALPQAKSLPAEKATSFDRLEVDPLASIDDPTTSPSDLVEILQARLETNRTELKRAEEQLNFALTSLAVNKRLTDRNPGVVSRQEQLKTEAEVKVATADKLIKEAEIREVEVRLRQATRRSVIPTHKPARGARNVASDTSQPGVAARGHGEALGRTRGKGPPYSDASDCRP